MEQETEYAQPWINQDSDDTAKRTLEEAEKRRSMAMFKNRYKIIADLMAGKEADITTDTAIFGAINKERMALEDYMKLFPEHTRDAALEAAAIREAIGNGKDYNPRSLAKWRIPGIMPRCVAELYMEVYAGDRKAMYIAFKRFFNQFPAFRISDKPI